MPRMVSLIVCAAVTTLAVAAASEHPECESFEATQPVSGTPEVLLVYTWDGACGPDPALGPVQRDDDPVELEWESDTSSSPHEHTALDTGLSTGVHSYDLTVTPEGEDAYVLADSVLVTGTSSSDTDPDTDSEVEDAGADTDSAEDEDDAGEVEAEEPASNGCSAAPFRARKRGAIAALAVLLG